MKKFSAIFFCLVAAALTAHAEEAVLKATKGQVYVRTTTATQYHAAKDGQLLQRNDRIRIDDGGVAQIIFKSGDTMLVKDKSRFSIKRDKKGTLVSFDIGEFLIGLKRKLDAAHSFRVRTPASVAAVRGTSFWGMTDGNKKSTFACFTGKIEIWGANKSVTIEPGQTVSIAFGTPPGTPVPSEISPGLIDTFAVAGSLQGVDDIINHKN